MLTTSILERALPVLMLGITKALLPTAERAEVAKQKAAYEEDVERVVAMTGLTRAEVIAERGEFKVNEARATDYAQAYIDIGIGVRLKGAIAHFELGNQLECLRHIILALNAVSHILKWDEAAEYLNEQNDHLLAKKKRA